MGKGIIEKTQNFIKNNNLFDFLVCVISSKATSIMKRMEYYLLSPFQNICRNFTMCTIYIAYFDHIF